MGASDEAEALARRDSSIVPEWDLEPDLPLLQEVADGAPLVRRRFQHHCATLALLSVLGIAFALALTAFRRPTSPSRSAPGGGVQLFLLRQTLAERLGQEDRLFENITEAFDALKSDDGMIHTSAGKRISFDVFQGMVEFQKQKALVSQPPEVYAFSSNYKAKQALAPFLNQSAPPMVLRRPDEKVSATEGFVTELYTFGSPGSSPAGLYDAMNPNGCFAGLRVFLRSSRFEPGTGIHFAISDPVASVTAGFKYKHANMEVLEAGDGNDLDRHIISCGYHPDRPPFDNFWWIPGHMAYDRVMQSHADVLPGATRSKADPFDLPWPPLPAGQMRRLQSTGRVDFFDMTRAQKVERANLMAHFAFMVYRQPQTADVDARIWGWNLVGRSCSDSAGAFGGVLGMALKPDANIPQTLATYIPGCTDHVSLYQHDQSLECAMVWEGSGGRDTLDWLANLNFFPHDFCGFGSVHAGFRAKMLRMLGGIDFAQSIRHKLPFCSNVTIVGHSLGAAQAEMFAACANKGLKQGDKGFAEYRLASFKRVTPKRLTPWLEEQVKGSFFRNKGTNLCIDVKGTMETDYASEIILFVCEIGNFDHGMDQQWELTPTGFLVNKLSGKCMDGNSTRPGPHLKQWTCETGSDTDQKWELTPEGFLRNLHDGTCLDSSMALSTCPYTDQKWESKPDGQIVNTLSNKCLGTAVVHHITVLVLRPCGVTGSDLFNWKLLDNGALQHVAGGMCVNVKHTEGEVNKPSLVLGGCNTALQWEHTEDGFFRDKRYGKCMNVAGKPGTETGAAINLRTCEAKTIFWGGIWKQLPGGFLANVGSDVTQAYECIEVYGSELDMERKKADGVRLFMNICERGTDQKWELTKTGFLRNAIGGQKCLTVNPFTGMPWLQNCEDPETPSLFLDIKWEKLASGQLRNKLHLTCMDVFGNPGTKDGADIDLWKCETSGDTDQAWELTDKGTIVNKLSGKCLGIRGFAVAHPPLELQTCADEVEGSTQGWTLTEHGFLVSQSYKKCVAVQRGIGTKGTFIKQVVMLTCPSTSQQWELTDEGQLKNKETGRCIDSASNATSTSWKMMVWPCVPGRKFQQFDVLPGS